MLLVLGLIYAFAPSDARVRFSEAVQAHTMTASVQAEAKAANAAPAATPAGRVDVQQFQALEVDASRLTQPFLNIAFKTPEPGSLQADLAALAAAACERYCGAISGQAKPAAEPAQAAASL